MKKCVFLLLFTSLISCAHISKTSENEHCTEDSEVCILIGMLTMGSDGHGYIGKMVFSENSCVDVSLPDEISKELITSGQVEMTLKGDVMPFPFDEDILFFKINGRKIGYVQCGSFYVYVEDQKSIKMK